MNVVEKTWGVLFHEEPANAYNLSVFVLLYKRVMSLGVNRGKET